jgi:PAS domain S-box-containing protein
LASGDAVVMLSPRDDAILDANPTACDLLGYGKSELLRRRVSDIHPEDMPLLMKLADVAMGWGEGWTDALSCVTKSGRIVPAAAFFLRGRNASQGVHPSSPIAIASIPRVDDWT